MSYVPIPEQRNVAFLQFVLFSAHFVSKRYILQHVSEEANRKMRARNSVVQLLEFYTDPERHNTQRYRRTDRQTRL